MPMGADLVKKANCFACKYFAVTWEPKRPKACKLFGFKSAELPSIAVYKSTGADCMGFEKKTPNIKGKS